MMVTRKLYALLIVDPSCINAQVTLVDKGERFTFKPLLYELLNNTATEDEVAPYFNQLLAAYPVQFVQVCPQDALSLFSDSCSTCTSHPQSKCLLACLQSGSWSCIAPAFCACCTPPNTMHVGLTHSSVLICCCCATGPGTERPACNRQPHQQRSSRRQQHSAGRCRCWPRAACKRCNPGV